MGMFDTLHFNCPDCGRHIEEQTKAGECMLLDIPADAVPLEVAGSVEGDVVYCEKCRKRWCIALDNGIKKTVPMKLAPVRMCVCGHAFHRHVVDDGCISTKYDRYCDCSEFRETP